MENWKITIETNLCKQVIEGNVKAIRDGFSEKINWKGKVEYIKVHTVYSASGVNKWFDRTIKEESISETKIDFNVPIEFALALEGVLQQEGLDFFLK